MKDFKNFVTIFTMAVMLSVVNTIEKAFESKSALYYIVALIITVGMCWFMLFLYTLYGKGLRNRYNKKLRKLAQDAIQGVKEKYDLSIKGLDIKLNGAYVDIIDLMNNQRMVDTLNLPRFETYVDHPEVLSLASKQDLEHTLYVIVSRYDPENETTETENQNGGKN